MYSDGNIAWGKVRYDIYSPRNSGKYDVKSDLNNRTYYRNATELPLSDRGSLIVGFTNWDKAGADNSSRTWMYNPARGVYARRPSTATTSRRAGRLPHRRRRPPVQRPRRPL